VKAPTLRRRAAGVRSSGKPLTAEQLTLAWQSASLLLDYPDQELLDQLDLVRSASHRLPDSVVEAITATLPPLQGDEAEAVKRLAAEGPPEEEVGLTPYATPAFDPGPAVPSGPVTLPMPSFPGGR
jgi:hypothetical protein